MRNMKLKGALALIYSKLYNVSDWLNCNVSALFYHIANQKSYINKVTMPLTKLFSISSRRTHLNAKEAVLGSLVDYGELQITVGYVRI